MGRRRLAHPAHRVDGDDEIVQLVARDARDLRAEHDDGVRRLRPHERDLEGGDEPLALAVLEAKRREARGGGDAVGVGVERLLEERERARAPLRARAEPLVVVRPEEELGGVEQIARARLRLRGQLGERGGRRDGAVGVPEARSRAARARSPP